MRFPILTNELLSERQKAVTSRYTDQRSNVLLGPFSALIYSPEIADRVAQLAAELSHELRVPTRLWALAILVAAARYRTTDAARLASSDEIRGSGLGLSKIEHLAKEVLPSDLTDDELKTYEFCKQITQDGRVHDETFDALAALVGKEICLELVVLCGHVLYLTSLINITQA